MKKLNELLIVLFSVLFIVSCQKDELEISSSNAEDATESEYSGEQIILGKQLENPYSIKNMQLSFKNLSGEITQKSANISDESIYVTHLYVRFLPKSLVELDILRNDTTLDLFDYPLDYEINERGTYYHDPSLPDTAITWQYCAVEKNYSFPDIEYEVLEKLFLPETVEEETTLRSATLWSFWDDLEVEALKITGNYEIQETSDTVAVTPRWGRSKWKPKGTITANGTAIIGCKVRAYSWFTCKDDLTDSDGDFYINHNFKGHVNYSIKWERHYWSIRSGTWGQAYYNGPRYKKKDWNLNITGGKSLRYAYIHMAAYDYFYRNPFNTHIPFDKKWYRSDLKIGYYDKLGDIFGDYAKWRNWLTWPHIRVYKGASSTRSTTQIYATTIHELAHCAHMQKIISAKGSNRISDFYNADNKLIESWARGVEREFTRHFISSTYTPGYHGDYTGIVHSLLPIGYTLKQLEDALVEASTMDEWKNNIESKYENTNENQLDAIFARF